ncbi:hypothetical protein LTS18_010301 [Coniosporium uncinatum]|uniref:Uncharacterized protein n=1 Tax=Coniosporium uncinatum TaxID=93489 RepID=A0ACC3D008_9PEZI|nr:hypothetical protein LTS18_010301 [Coniosporium uncinatum]
MRGLASLFVFIRHYSSAWHRNIQSGFGANGSNHYIPLLPFIRLVIQGPAMLSVFFLVSGYALSWGPLKALTGRDGTNKCLRKLVSATFRRPIRLFLPGLCSTFVIMLCVSAGLYDRGELAATEELMPGFHEPQPPMLEGFEAQTGEWWRCTKDFVNVWNLDNHCYDAHLWTLNVEFRYSMALFMTICALARTHVIGRVVGLLGMVVYCQWENSWEGWSFFAGALLVQINLLSYSGEDDDVEELPLPTATVSKTKLSWLEERGGSLEGVAVFVLALYLLSMPDYASSAPGYRTLAAFSPPTWGESWRFWHGIGSLLLLWTTAHSTLLQQLFTNPFSRYFGKLSYALYLMHGPVVHMLGYWLVPWCQDHISGRGNVWQREFGFAIASVVVVAATVWAADLFWRVCDKGSVRLARWIEGWVMRRD